MSSGLDTVLKILERDSHPLYSLDTKEIEILSHTELVIEIFRGFVLG